MIGTCMNGEGMIGIYEWGGDDWYLYEWGGDDWYLYEWGDMEIFGTCMNVEVGDIWYLMNVETDS